MSKKSALGGLLLAIGLSLLTACGSTASTSPPPTSGHTVHQMCSVPQIPACGY